MFKIWLMRHSFLLKTFIAWLILCVPLNIVTLVTYIHHDYQIIKKENYTCYDWNLSLLHTMGFWLNGISVSVLGCCGIFGNLFSILVLRRLATKSGFNKLLLSLGNDVCWVMAFLAQVSKN